MKRKKYIACKSDRLFFISGLVLFDITTGSVPWDTDNRNWILSENDEYEQQHYYQNGETTFDTCFPEAKMPR